MRKIPDVPTKDRLNLHDHYSMAPLQKGTLAWIKLALSIQEFYCKQKTMAIDLNYTKSK